MSNNLSHWKLVGSFSQKEAAYLAVGIDPMVTNLPPDLSAKVLLMEREISSAVDRAFDYAWRCYRKIDNPQIVDDSVPDAETLKLAAPDIWEVSGAMQLFLPIWELRDNVGSAFSDPENYKVHSRSGWAECGGTETLIDHELDSWFKYNDFEPAFDFIKRRLNHTLHSPISFATPESTRNLSGDTYSTKWLEIQQAAIAQFFNPRRNPDAKKEEVISWINLQAVNAGLGESNNIASTIFTIIKPENHDPKKKRV